MTRTRQLRHGDHVGVRVCKWDRPKISRQLEAVINTKSIVSKIPAKIWQELDVKPLFEHWQTRKPAALVLFNLRGHRASDSVIVTKGEASPIQPVLTVRAYGKDSKRV